ncbi:unnamed protein product [Linum tenue]|uniref:ENTH domain-containing protein n=1 Tax=Linum tenue TaxID=586396 RepID=A0AAV0R984_9ROSI|nr:unnamed protein product [Linum tenue]
MKLWRKAAGAVKDQNSILLASFLTPRSSSRDGSLEAAIIKATSHDGDSVDYRHARRVFEWIRTSPVSLKPLVWGLSVRMERTQSWVVALKGLMLMHGIFCCDTPAVHRIGRLPFDLSNFADGHSNPTKVWGYNTFVRAYFTFLDRRSSLLYPTCSTNHKCRRMLSSKRTAAMTTPPPAANDEDNHDDHDVVTITKLELWQEIQKLQKWQKLLDLLLQIKPLADNMKRDALIMEAMDCVIAEIFDLYGNICSGVSRVLMEVHSAGKAESTMALRVLQKARVQGKNMVLYFEFCRAFGVFSAMEVPKVTPIPEEDIKLEEMVAKKGGDYYKATSDAGAGFPLHEKSYKAAMEDDDGEVTKKKMMNVSITASGRLQTVITDEWEVFDDDNDQDSVGNYGDLLSLCDVGSSPPTNPFEMPDDQLMDLLSTLPTPTHEQYQLCVYKQDELPDLISF